MAKSLIETVNIPEVIKHTANYRRYTSSLSSDAYSTYINKLNNTPIDYDSCLTFRQIAEKYNDLYVAFINDYNNLHEKLNIGKELDLTEYYESKDNYRRARFFVYENNQIGLDDDSAEFDIIEDNGIIRCRLHNDYNKSMNDPKYFSDALKIKPEVLKSYLDFCQRHQEFIKLFYAMRNSMPLSDGTWVMINMNRDIYFDLTNGLKDLCIHGYLSNTDDFIFDIYFKLGEDFGIDYKRTKFQIHDKEVKFPQEQVEEFIDNMYVNKYYIIVRENLESLRNHHDMQEENDIYRLYLLKDRLTKYYGREFTIDMVINIMKKICGFKKPGIVDVINGNNVYFFVVLHLYFNGKNDDEIFEEYLEMIEDYDYIFNNTIENDPICRRRGIASRLFKKPNNTDEDDE